MRNFRLRVRLQQQQKKYPTFQKKRKAINTSFLCHLYGHLIMHFVKILTLSCISQKKKVWSMFFLKKWESTCCNTVADKIREKPSDFWGEACSCLVKLPVLLSLSLKNKWTAGFILFWMSFKTGISCDLKRTAEVTVKLVDSLLRFDCFDGLGIQMVCWLDNGILSLLPSEKWMVINFSRSRFHCC